MLIFTVTTVWNTGETGNIKRLFSLFTIVVMKHKPMI